MLALRVPTYPKVTLLILPLMASSALFFISSQRRPEIEKSAEYLSESERKTLNGDDVVLDGWLSFIESASTKDSFLFPVFPPLRRYSAFQSVWHRQIT